MTSIDCLNAVSSFIKTEIAEKTLLLKDNAIGDKEYVHPMVYEIVLPHKNFQPTEYTAPFILIGLVNGVDDVDSNSLDIRIQVGTWGGEYIECETPKNNGYIELLNLLEFIKQAIVNQAVIGGQCSVQRPIRYGVYDEEPTYPYWYGYVEFSVELPVNEYSLNKLNF